LLTHLYKRLHRHRLGLVRFRRSDVVEVATLLILARLEFTTAYAAPDGLDMDPEGGGGVGDR
jgi:hypothetical protein